MPFEKILFIGIEGVLLQTRGDKYTVLYREQMRELFLKLLEHNDKYKLILIQEKKYLTANMHALLAETYTIPLSTMHNMFVLRAHQDSDSLSHPKSEHTIIRQMLTFIAGIDIDRSNIILLDNCSENILHAKRYSFNVIEVQLEEGSTKKQKHLAALESCLQISLMPLPSEPSLPKKRLTRTISTPLLPKFKQQTTEKYVSFGTTHVFDDIASTETEDEDEAEDVTATTKAAKKSSVIPTANS